MNATSVRTLFVGNSVLLATWAARMIATDERRVAPPFGRSAPGSRSRQGPNGHSIQPCDVRDAWFVRSGRRLREAQEEIAQARERLPAMADAVLVRARHLAERAAEGRV